MEEKRLSIPNLTKSFHFRARVGKREADSYLDKLHQSAQPSILETDYPTKHFQYSWGHCL
jgi:hypothetical protein